MKNSISFVLLFLSGLAFAQVGIGTTSPDAFLDINSSTNGILIPRVSLTSKAVSAPVVNPSGGVLINGTLVFNTATTTLGTNDDVIPGFYFWDTTTIRWVFVGNDPKIATTTWNLLGNATTNPATHFLGTTNNQDVVFRRNNTRAGLLSLDNTSFGVNALPSSTGINNSAFGRDALKDLTVGNDNSAFGFDALAKNTTGLRNCAFGRLALARLLIGSDNAAFGANALRENTGSFNSAFGSNALLNNIGGGLNTAFGVNTLSSVTNQGANTSFGSFSLELNTAGNNSAFGALALQINTSGTRNNGFGLRALVANTTGNDNSAFGTNALRDNTTSSGNVAFGNNAGRFVTGGNNTLLGFSAGSGATNGLTVGSNNIAIGANTLFADFFGDNQLNIGNAIFGTGLNGSILSPAGNIGIGTVAPTAKLHINGNVAMAFTEITATTAVTNGQGLIIVNNLGLNVTITLPSPVGVTGLEIFIGRINSTSTGTITIATGGAGVTIENLDGTETLTTTLSTIGSFGAKVTFISNGVKWLRRVNG
jgi:hypothetical protein